MEAKNDAKKIKKKNKYIIHLNSLMFFPLENKGLTALIIIALDFRGGFEREKKINIKFDF